MVDLIDLTPRPAEPDRSGAPPSRGPDLGEEFGRILSLKMKDLNDLQRESARLDRALAAGEAVDIHQVMIAAAKAGLALDLAVQVRNAALRAYTQVTQIR
jgi:flagellar hook-basal body complex protein FliE